MAGEGGLAPNSHLDPGDTSIQPRGPGAAADGPGPAGDRRKTARTNPRTRRSRPGCSRTGREKENGANEPTALRIATTLMSAQLRHARGEPSPSAKVYEPWEPKKNGANEPSAVLSGIPQAGENGANEPNMPRSAAILIIEQLESGAARAVPTWKPIAGMQFART